MTDFGEMDVAGGDGHGYPANRRTGSGRGSSWCNRFGLCLLTHQSPSWRLSRCVRVFLRAQFITMRRAPRMEDSDMYVVHLRPIIRRRAIAARRPEAPESAVGRGIGAPISR